MGKRPVYILPIYPALSLLMAIWFYHHGAAAGTRRVLYRLMAAFAAAASSCSLSSRWELCEAMTPVGFFRLSNAFSRPKTAPIFWLSRMRWRRWLVFHGCVAVVGASLAVPSSFFVGKETRSAASATCLNCGTSCFHYSGRSHARNSGSEKLSRFHGRGQSAGQAG